MARVVDRVESLEEALTEDEVQPGSTIGANVSNNQINATGGTANKSVKVARPDLSVRGYFKWNLAKKEEMLLHATSEFKRPMIEHIPLQRGQRYSLALRIQQM